MAVREVLDNASVLQAEVSALNDLLAVQEGVVIDQSAKLEQAVHEAQAAQERWQSTFDAISDFVAVVDKDHLILAANEAVRKAAPGKEVVGMHCYELFHGTTSPRHNCPFEEAARTGKPARAEWSEPHFQGRWIDVSTFPILEKDGSVEQLVHVVRDVTDRQSAEERFRVLFESSCDAIMTIAPPSWNFTSGNAAAMAVFRAKNEEEFLLHGPWDLSPERQPDGRVSAEKAREMIETAMRGGSHFFEWTHQRLNGEEFPANVLLTRVEQAGKVFILATVRDITGQKRAEEALKAKTADLERANEEVKQFAYIVSHDFRAPLVNLKGFAGEVRSPLSAVASALEAALPHLSEEQRKAAAAALQTDVPEALHFIETAAANMDNYVNALLKLSRMGRQEHTRLATKVFESAAEGIVVTDPQFRIVSANQAFTAITGYAPEEVVGKDARLFQSGLHDAKFYREMWAALTEAGGWHGEIWNRRKNGEAYPAWLTLSVVKDERGRTTHYAGIFMDVTTQKQAEEYLRHRATHDPLTDLPNRELFRDRLCQVLSLARREKRLAAVMLLDLDHFKPVNDSLGHATGDRVLQGVARRLLDGLRDCDTAARLGGDEFAVLLPEITDSEDAAQIALRLLEALAKPFVFGSQECSISASLGISLYPAHGATADALLSSADSAMYYAKERRNCYALFRPAAQPRPEQAICGSSASARD